MISIVVPSIKSIEENKKQKQEIEKTLKGDVELLYICENRSASVNRNACIDSASGDIIIMLDDDIFGVYDNWYNDLVYPLINFPDKYSIVSARLLDINGNIGSMLGDNSDKTLYGEYQVAKHSDMTGLQLVCSACISFKKSDGIRFDERYKGGGCYEDTHFSMEYREKFPKKNIILNNNVKLIHNCESKNRGENGTRNYWRENREYFNNYFKIKERFGVMV